MFSKKEAKKGCIHRAEYIFLKWTSGLNNRAAWFSWETHDTHLGKKKDRSLDIKGDRANI